MEGSVGFWGFTVNFTEQELGNIWKRIQTGLHDARLASCYMLSRLKHLKGLSFSNHDSSGLTGEMDVDVLTQKLFQGHTIDNSPRNLTVRGNFFPALLLTSGWWERQDGDERERIRFSHPLQNWLFSGFELWGPSWDVNSEQGDLYGQLGTGDETNSLMVVIEKEKAQIVRYEHLRNRGEVQAKAIFPAIITGELCHRRKIGNGFSGMPSYGDRRFDYCLLVRDDNPAHKVVAVEDDSIYSGYLWKCLCPAYKLKTKEPLRLEDVYFVWEHTNLACADSIKYNLDSLNQKVEYLKNKLELNNMVVLQTSSSIIPDKPAWEKERFHDFAAFVTGRSAQA